MGFTSDWSYGHTFSVTAGMWLACKHVCVSITTRKRPTQNLHFIFKEATSDCSELTCSLMHNCNITLKPGHISFHELLLTTLFGAIYTDATLTQWSQIHPSYPQKLVQPSKPQDVSFPGSIACEFLHDGSYRIAGNVSLGSFFPLWLTTNARAKLKSLRCNSSTSAVLHIIKILREFIGEVL